MKLDNNIFFLFSISMVGYADADYFSEDYPSFAKKINPAIYDTLFVIDGEYSGLINDTGYYYSTLHWTYKNGLWGMVADDTMEIIPCVYDLPFIETDEDYYNELTGIDPERVFLWKKDGSMVWYNIFKGEMTLENVKYYQTDTSGGVLFQDGNNKFGYANTDGFIIIPPISSKPPIVLDSNQMLFADQNKFYLSDYSGKNRKLIDSLDELEQNTLIIPLIIKLVGHYFDSLEAELKNNLIHYLFPSLSSYFIEHSSYFYSDPCETANWVLFFDSVNDFDSDDCNLFPPWYGAFMEEGIEYQKISKHIIEKSTSQMITGHGHGDVSFFKYFHIDNQKNVFGLPLSEIFNCSVEFKEVIKKFIQEFFNKGNAHDLEIDENEQIDFEHYISFEMNEASEGLYQLSEDSLFFYVPYDMGRYQYPVGIAYNQLEKFILKKELLKGIRKVKRY